MADTERVDAIERAKRNDAEARKRSAGINTRERNAPYNKLARGIFWGAIAGVAVGIYQFILNATEDGLNIGMSLVGFFLMTPFIYLGLRELKAHMAAGEFYKNAALMGLFMSAAAGVVTVVIAVLTFAVFGSGGEAEIATIQGINFGQVLANSVFQVVVALVIGQTIAFIFMQGMKSDVPSDEFIENQEGHA